MNLFDRAPALPRDRRAGLGRRALTIAGATALLACAGPAAAQAATPYLSLVAGTPGSSGPSVAGGATATDLNSPSGVAVDSSGNVYIADQLNNEVEEVTSAGELSIIAGTGSPGAPAAGLAVDSRLSDPDGVAVDSSGNVYIADENNDEVEKVTPGGVLSIIAGTGSESNPTNGTATSVQLNGPCDVAVEPSGDVLIADGCGDDSFEGVEQVTPAGQLTILAGNTSDVPGTAGPALSSGMLDPTAVAYDAAGDIYVADSPAEEVYKVTPGGNLSIFAGDGSGGTSSAGAATSSRLSWPDGLAVDASGNVYIANQISGEIDQVTPAGQLSILGGTGTNGSLTYGPLAASQLDGPAGLASTPLGAVFVTDQESNTIDKIAPQPPVTSSAPVVTGDAVQGDTLSTTPGVWTNDPVELTYRWQDCPVEMPTVVEPHSLGCTYITGATGSTYTLTAADVGYRIRVVVTAVNAGGQGLGWSTETAVVTAPPAPSPTPTTTTPTPTTTTTTTTTPTTSPVPVTTPVETTPAPTPAPACPAPTGSLRGTHLGVFELGESRDAARAAMPNWRLYPYGFDDFCLFGGDGIRVDYPSSRVLASVARDARSRIDGRIVLALTSDPYYSLDGVRPTTRLESVARRLHVGEGLHVGLNWWYVVPGTAANGILKVRDGVIDEVGIAEKSLTGTRAAEAKLF